MPRRDFEDVVVPHLDAAFNYARWLTKNDADAEDVVQDATIRALRFFSSLRNDDARAWLLTIVRNTWYGRVALQSHAQRSDRRSADRHGHVAPVAGARTAADRPGADGVRWRPRMNCHDVGHLLNAYIDNELAPTEAASIAGHVEGCAA